MPTVNLWHKIQMICGVMGGEKVWDDNGKEWMIDFSSDPMRVSDGTTFVPLDDRASLWRFYGKVSDEDVSRQVEYEFFMEAKMRGEEPPALSWMPGDSDGS